MAVTEPLRRKLETCNARDVNVPQNGVVFGKIAVQQGLKMSILHGIRQPKVLFMKWGLHGSRLRIIFIFLCIAIVTLTVLLIRRQKNSFLGAKDFSDVQYHAKIYCNKPGNVQGEEGKLMFIKGTKRSYQIEQVHIVIRHGDRAPIVLDTLPNSKPVEISCLFNKSWDFQKELLEIKRGKDAFEVTGATVYPVIQERRTCVGGQLTPIGFSQHLNNGRFLKRQYGSFFDEIRRASNVKVKSTSYSRTVQSAASLLYGIFGDKFGTDKLIIEVESDKYRETHFLQNGSGDHIYCPALIQKLKDIWKIDNLQYLKNRVIKPMQEEYAKLFNAHIGKIASLDRLIDIIYADLCHTNELPKGPHGALSYKLARNSLGTANQLITIKHSKVAELQTLAIVSQIVAKVSQLIDERNKGESVSSRLVLFSGHDTIISPLLSLLSIHDWRWPPYASRVVFELWRDTDRTESKTKRSNHLSKFEGYFIRVLYNGEPLTSKVNICQGSLVDNQLCPVSAFVKYVADDQFDGNNYFERIKDICVGTGTE